MFQNGISRDFDFAILNSRFAGSLRKQLDVEKADEIDCLRIAFFHVLLISNFEESSRNKDLFLKKHVFNV